MPKSVPKFSELNVRPNKEYDEWRQILKEEVIRFWANGDKIKSDSGCPGCGGVDRRPCFEVFGVSYFSCKNCNSVYVARRPNQDELDKFYQNSKAASFWKEKMIKNTETEREKNHWQPAVEWLKQMLHFYLPSFKDILEYRPKYKSVLVDYFSDVVDNVDLFQPLLVDINSTNPHIKVNIFDKLDDEGKTWDVVVAFNVLDRETDPMFFVNLMRKKIKTGGILFLTMNTSSGFEYQVLGNNSRRLLPPDRLNLLSIEAVEKLLNDNGFEVAELSTPGKLDVDIIFNEYKRDPNIILPEFLRYMFEHRPDALWSLQNFLQLNNLSSYLRAVALKK